MRLERRTCSRHEPTTWLCPIQDDEGRPCLELLADITRVSCRVPEGVCPLHGTFRWAEVGGWVR